MFCSGSFPLGAHLYSAGKVFPVLAAHPKSPGSLGAVWHLPYHALARGRARESSPCCEISQIQRYIPWTSSPTLWLISSFPLQFSVPEVCMKNANKVIICNFCTISFRRSSFQSGAVSQVHLKNCDFVIDFNRRRIFTLSCKRSQLYITDFYCIS